MRLKDLTPEQLQPGLQIKFSQTSVINGETQSLTEQSFTGVLVYRFISGLCAAYIDQVESPAPFKAPIDIDYGGDSNNLAFWEAILDDEGKLQYLDVEEYCKTRWN